MTALFILIDPVHWTKGAFRLLVWLGYASFLNRWKMPTTPQTVPKSDVKNSSLCASNGKELRQTRRQERLPNKLATIKTAARTAFIGIYGLPVSNFGNALTVSYVCEGG